MPWLRRRSSAGLFSTAPQTLTLRSCPSREKSTTKPAHGSGGVGVMTHATSWDQVLSARQEHATDKYLLQAHIIPKQLEMRPAWFRVIYCTGQIYPCWWEPQSHVYAPVTLVEKNCHGLSMV